MTPRQVSRYLAFVPELQAAEALETAAITLLPWMKAGARERILESWRGLTQEVRRVLRVPADQVGHFFSALSGRRRI